MVFQAVNDLIQKNEKIVLKESDYGKCGKYES